MKTIYRASFFLGHPGKKGPTMDQIIDHIKQWVAPRFAKGGLEDFHQGLTISTGAQSLETIRAYGDDSHVFGMRFIHPDRVQQDFLWQTSIALKIPLKGNPIIDVALANGWLQNDMLLPSSYTMTRPSLVPKLIEKFSAHLDYALYANALPVQNRYVRDFVDVLYNFDRKLPVVFISCQNKNDMPYVDPDRVAFTLAGLAHVHVAENRFTSFRLQKMVPENAMCYDGDIRVVWPMVYGKSVCSHNLFLRTDIIDRPTFDQVLLMHIGQFSSSRTPIISYDTIHQISFQKRIKELIAKTDNAELAELYAQENSRLQSLLKETTDNYQHALQRQEEKTQFLCQRVLDLEAKLTLTQLQQENTVSKQLPDMETVLEAVTYFKSMYPEVPVELLKRAERGAKECTFDDPLQVFKALEWLGTVYVNSRMGKITLDLGKSSLEQTGMQYRSHQKETTMGNFSEEYYIQVRGKTVPLAEHLVQGTNRDGRKTIRIAFAYDKDTQKVLIGFIGQHQTTRNS